MFRSRKTNAPPRSTIVRAFRAVRSRGVGLPRGRFARALGFHHHLHLLFLFRRLRASRAPFRRAREPFAVRGGSDVWRHLRVYPLVQRAADDVRGLRAQSGHERVPLLGCHRRQFGEVRPRRFGRDVVRGDARRYPPPIRDARAEQSAPSLPPAEVAEVAVFAVVAANARVVGLRREIRWYLHDGVWTEDEPRRRGRPQEFLERGFRVISHSGVRLGAKILHDDLVHVARRRASIRGARPVRVAYGEERVDSLFARLSDADEHPARERHAKFAGEGRGSQSRRGPLALAPFVRGVGLVDESVRRGFEHQTLGDGDFSQLGEFFAGQDAGVAVREEADASEHFAGAVREVIDGGGVSHGAELVARGGVARLGAVAECEEALGGARATTALGDVEDLVEGHVDAIGVGGIGGEGAVAARVAARARQRHEHLGGEGHQARVRAARARLRRERAQLVERGGVNERVHLVARQVTVQVRRAGRASGGNRSASAHASRHRRPPTRRRAAETRRGMRRGRARERRVRTHRRRTQRRRARREGWCGAPTRRSLRTRGRPHTTRNVALGSSSSRQGSVRPASSPCLSRPRGEAYPPRLAETVGHF